MSHNTALSEQTSKELAVVILAAMDSEFRSVAEIAYRARLPWRRCMRFLDSIRNGGPIEVGWRGSGSGSIRVWRKKR